MTDAPKIVGITLLRNEDIFVERVVRNAVDFCDLLIIADHGSTDGTYAIVSRLAAEFPERIRLVQIKEARESHFLINGYANSPTWVFAVDGDEIYDPVGLAEFRKEILSGKYDATWQVFGNVLNCVEADGETGEASGYLAPPCRSMTKLFNFRAIESWDGAATQRLHNGTIKFRPGYDGSLRLNLHETLSWDDARFRCLHLCFMPRSTLDQGESVARPNVSESLWSGPVLWIRQLFYRLLRRPMPSDWKRAKYARGPLTKVDACAFFPVKAGAVAEGAEQSPAQPRS